MSKLKYTNELKNELCGYIEAGATNKDAVIMVNISESELYLWLSEDEKNPLTQEDRSELSESMGRARAKRNTALANRIINASQDEYLKDVFGEFILDKLGKKIVVARGDWRSAAWYLERTMPEDYVVEEKVKHSGQIDSKVNFNVPKELVDAYNRAIREIATKRGGSEGSTTSEPANLDASPLPNAQG